MTQRQRSLIGGISVLGAAGLICKVVGVLYRIPLSNMIGGLGMGLFGQVMPWYNLLLSITSAGIPVAISRMVSHYVTIGEPGNARKVFKTALKLLTVLGIVSTIILLLCSRLLATFVKTPEGYQSFICIAPSLFFVCIMSAYRGYMQGMRRMMPTAISQLIEQVGKVAVALPLASIGFAQGGEETGWILGSAGALLGTSLAECVAMLYMIIRCHFVKTPPALPNESRVSDRALAKRIVMIAIPITLGACIVPLSNSIDAAMLKSLMMDSGFTDKAAQARHGLLTGIVFPLINVPTALAMAMSTNLVPAVASGLARKDMKFVARETGIGLQVASVVGFPCSIGMSLMAKPIVFLCFGRSYTLEHLLIASSLLEFSAMTIILFTMVQATSGALQGAGKQKIAMLTLVAGVVCKIALNAILVSRYDINIHGAPIASLVCYSVSMIPNLYFTCKYTSYKFSVMNIIIRPLAAAAVMGGAVLAVYNYVFGGEQALLAARFSKQLLMVAVCIAVGAVVYLVAAILFKAINPDHLPARFRRKKAK